MEYDYSARTDGFRYYAPGFVVTSITFELSQLPFCKRSGQNCLPGGLWNKAMVPITTAALVLAAMPFVFVSGRAGNLGVRLFLGMLLGGSFIVLENLVQQTGQVYGIHAALINALPPFLLIFGSVFMLRRSD